MAHSIEGRVALITGASRGIGQAVACRFAAEGADVALIGRGGTKAFLDRVTTGAAEELYADTSSFAGRVLSGWAL